MEATEIKKLKLEKGDILVVQRSYCTGTPYWMEALRDAGREAGVNFNVPIVFVDDINEVAVIRMGENAIQQNGTTTDRKL
jgi:hypothetical protein